MEPLIVLVPSPFVGPFAWEAVAAALREQGRKVVVPDLVSSATSVMPYWEQHAQAVCQALRPYSESEPLVLVGHSGAGPLLPAINMICGHPTLAYLFVDAKLPHGGLSRLAEMELTSPEQGQQLRADLEAGEVYPSWSDEDLVALIPDEQPRQGLLRAVRPLGLDFFTEPLPMIEEWPDAPCGYLRFSTAYTEPAQRAQRDGWLYQALDAGHFHMLVEPARVASLLLEMAHFLQKI